MRSVMATLVVASVVLLAACSEGGMSAAPTSPSPTGIAPVSGVNPSPVLPTSFQFIDVTDMSMPSWELPIWALRGRNNADLVKQVAFCDLQGGTLSDSPNQVERPGFYRLQNAPVVFVYNPAVFGEREVTLFEMAAAQLSEVTDISASVGTTSLAISSAWTRVELVLNGNMPGTVNAQTFLFPNGSAIFRGRVEFRDFERVRLGTVVHEFGHVAGLCHTNENEGMMGRRSNSTTTFSLAEKDNFAMMYRLAPGTTYPGASWGSRSLSKGGMSTVIIVD